MQWLRQLFKYAMWRLGKNGNMHASAIESSSDYSILESTDFLKLGGWHSREVAERQQQAFSPLLQAAHGGLPRQDFMAAAQAVAATRLFDPFVVEVGCGSGYYSEILPLLLGRPVHYVGIDYAASMTALAHHTYPHVPFVTGDACFLPLKTASCDVLFFGTSLMHIANYCQAIAESVRVSREWCIFHTIPVMAKRTTTFLRKKAYGEPVIEVIFNQIELEKWLIAHGQTIEGIFVSIPYNIQAVVGERTWTLTYLCRKT